MILRMCGQGISSAIDPDAGTTWDVVIELDVGRFGLIELHIPVTVRRDLLGEPLAERDLREGGSVRREGLGRERPRS